MGRQGQYYLLNFYFFPESFERGTAFVGAVAGAAGAELLVFTFCKRELSTLDEDPPFKNKLENNANKAIIPANSHVPFSKTSVVCLTPINWLLRPPTLADKPPPLGFCTKTINPSAAQAITIKIKNKIIIVYLLNVEFWRQNKRIFQDLRNLI